ncbi:cupin domain-containing protein [Treponema sp. OMZ 788]|uniref:cupin domain-containing protein n=1 Tax=Treponema sp. OMZ 788 TaxID=2563664 RepID=UPI0020A3E755|nr:cupin domain-containing protein [Treponema sp. OMZ 788]UTC65641.1 cupin domain-containing protein [Treponema sp. OMZ 788]
MIINKNDVPKKLKPNLRGGTGEISVIEFLSVREVENCRMFSEMTVPVGASIGEHVHTGETEIYIIHEGKGLVTDMGKKQEVGPGDVVITEDNQLHSLENTGSVPMVLTTLVIKH